MRHPRALRSRQGAVGPRLATKRRERVAHLLGMHAQAVARDQREALGVVRAAHGQRAAHVVVGLYRDDRRDARQQRARERADARADLHDGLVLAQVREAHDAAHHVVVHEEVLPELVLGVQAELVEQGTRRAGRRKS